MDGDRGRIEREAKRTEHTSCTVSARRVWQVVPIYLRHETGWEGTLLRSTLQDLTRFICHCVQPMGAQKAAANQSGVG